MELQEAQTLLELDSTSTKLHRLVGILAHEVEVLEMGQKIQAEARSEIDKVQREYFLREQLKAIQRELGEVDEQAAEVDEFRKKIELANMPEEPAKQARRELDRLSRLPAAASSAPTWIGWSPCPGPCLQKITWISLMLARYLTRIITGWKISRREY